MATIFQAPPQVPQQIAQQAPQQVQQASQPNTQDPLFQALARYITSGPGPSSTTVEAVQSIIDSHASQENGLEYLQSVVSPPQPTLRIWPRYGSAQGTIKTTLDALHLDFRVMAKNRDGQVGTSLGFEFKGEASGIFMPQLISFERYVVLYNPRSNTNLSSEFFWENIPWNDLVRFKLTYHRFLVSSIS